MPTEEFRLGDILSVITGYLISPYGLRGLYYILNFLTSNELSKDKNWEKANQKCRPHLLKQFPQFNSPEMKLEISNLDAVLKNTPSDIEARGKIIAGWLHDQVSKHGEKLRVKPILEMTR